MIDFDGCAVRGHYHAALHFMAANGQTERVINLLLHGVACVAKDFLGLPNEGHLRSMAKGLEGLCYESFLTRMLDTVEVNPRLAGVQAYVEVSPVPVAILSKNDGDLIEAVVEANAAVFRGYGIELQAIVANTYNKQDGHYTGDATIRVHNNKQDYYQYGFLFFGDAQDVAATTYPGVIRI